MKKEKKDLYKVKFMEMAENVRKTEKHEGILQKIEETGGFILTKHELKENALIDLWIYLDKNSNKDEECKKVLKVQAKVQWLASIRMPDSGVSGIGVEFFYRNWQDYKCIEKIVKQSSPEKFIIKNKNIILITVCWILIVLILAWYILKQH